jgi:alpha-1,6-mannosyltransferase
MPRRWLVVIGILMELSYLSFYLDAEGPGEVLLLIAVNVFAYALLAVFVWAARRNATTPENSRGLLILVFAFGMLFRLTLVPHGSVGSDDIYRYLWDGKVAASGINPYRYLPTDSHLSHLATAELPSKVNHPELRTAYPPMAQVLFFLSNKVFGDSAAGLKFLLVMIDCATLLILWRLLRERRGSAWAFALYAWSPLPVLYFGLDGHIDALGIPFLLVAVLFCLTRRPIRGIAALGLGALAKLIPLLLVPAFLGVEKGIRRLRVLILPIVITALGYLLYYEPTQGVFDSLKTLGSRWEFNGSLFSVFYFLSGSNETAHMISGALIVLYLCFLIFLDRPLLEKAFWALTGVVLLSPVVHPWYLTWLAALLALRWSPAVFVLLGLSFLPNIIVYQYRSYGQWNDQPLLLLIEYVPVFLLLAREIAQKKVLSEFESL